ncbi:hypothetical protein M0R04_10540 [Candidatus Dojkabacteria bacterium]|jgi:hypothetical protein|nr:hypothetical protein [Candidatus Dojkabacteria bacterium]
MKVIVNKEKKELSFDFDGKTYTFGVSKSPIKVSDELFNYLSTTVPLAFDFTPEYKKDTPVLEPTIVDTRTKFSNANFGIQSKKLDMNYDVTPKTQDKSFEGEVKGPAFYGPGLQDDTP